jgi:hypothetical protein
MEHSVRLDLRELGFEDGRWMELSQNRVVSFNFAVNSVEPSDHFL